MKILIPVLLYMSFGLYLYITQVKDFHRKITEKASVKTILLAHVGFLVYCLGLDPLRWVGALVIAKLKELAGTPDK